MNIHRSDRVIFHADLDCFYASVACQENPRLKGKCVAVCGDVENRHGIILAKSYPAKKYGIKTGEAIWEAKEKCPELILVKADYRAYKYYSNLVRNIYLRYSDCVESFGMDENWIDVTESIPLYGGSDKIAESIQREVLEETGLSVSIGIGWNKVIAKFASDYRKPFGITSILDERSFKKLFWSSPVEDLLYVGRKTKIKYNKWGIFTIGDLANDEHFIKNHGNKVDGIIQLWAQGFCADNALADFEDPVKSVGNSITTPKDLLNLGDCALVYQVLCESVATRLKRIGKQGCVITIYLRSSDLTGFSKQMKIDNYTNISSEILSVAMGLVKESYDFEQPLRSIGVKVSSLRDEDSIIQADLFGVEEKRRESKILDKTIDDIREKYGYNIIKRCCLLKDKELTGFNPLVDNTVHPVSVF